ncbi:MAG: DUF1801 domain-containing protein [Bergeyella sp.]
MSQNKTLPTEFSVEDFIKNSAPEKADDSFRLIEIMEHLSGEKAKMWGASIIGFGTYHYKYESGREGDMCRIGFSPRKDKFSLYVLDFEDEKQNQLVEKLGKIKMSKSCIYFKKLDDLNIEALEELIRLSLKNTKEKWG